MSLEALNPIIKYDLRRAGRTYTPNRRRIYTALLIFLSVMVALIIASANLDTLNQLSLLAAAAFGFGADSYYTLYLARNIQQESSAGRWDMLRLTPVGEES